MKKFEDKPVEFWVAILWPVGMLLLLAAGLDALPITDNTAIFIALVLFMVAILVQRVIKRRDLL